MVDTRFHKCSGPHTLRALLDAAGHGAIEIENPDFEIAGADELNAASNNDIVFAAEKKYAEQLGATRAGAAIVTQALREFVPTDSIAVIADDPHHVFADILDVLYPANSSGALKRLLTGEGAEPVLEDDVLIASSATIGPDTEIGAGTMIGPNAVIGAGVAIGRNCVISAGATVEYALIGNNVTINAGARIGTEGFGWLDLARSNRKIPQLGRVILQDKVEIGANATIDRGALGDTIIGENSKIDNLSQIGHNCVIGRNCLIAAMAGLSGSTIVGDSVLMGGNVGTSGHLSIGSGSGLQGRTAVTKSWPAGSNLAGAPAQDIRDFWKTHAALRRLVKGGKGES